MATLAMFLAVGGGGAFAVGDTTHQATTSHAARHKHGKRGPRGFRGPARPAGPQGAPGANGANGAPGASGAAGTSLGYGAFGANGQLLAGYAAKGFTQLAANQNTGVYCLKTPPGASSNTPIIVIVANTYINEFPNQIYPSSACADPTDYQINIYGSNGALTEGAFIVVVS